MHVESQEHLLIYRRAETTNREVLELLREITEPTNPLHDQALATCRRLGAILAELLRAPVDPDPTPPHTS